MELKSRAKGRETDVQSNEEEVKNKADQRAIRLSKLLERGAWITVTVLVWYYLGISQVFLSQVESFVFY